jgi:hypothetical protein
MQANIRHMVTQVEIANKRSDEKKANEKGANKTGKLVKWGR